MSFPTPKEEPVMYGTIASAIVSALAKYGIDLTAEQVLGVMVVLYTVVGVLIRHRVVAIHPSTGTTVGSPAVLPGQQVVQDQG